MKRMMLFKVLPALLLAGFAYLFSTQLERKQEVIDEGPAPEVSRNAFFAAGMLLEQRGLSVEHYRYPVDPTRLGRYDTLVLTDTSYLLEDDERIEQLLTWVDAGGRLIWPYSVDLGPDPLNEVLGIGHEYPGSDERSKASHKNKRLPDSETEAAMDETLESLAEELEVKARMERDALSPREQVRVDIQAREARVQPRELSRLELPGGEVVSQHFGELSLREALDTPVGAFRPRLEAVSRSAESVEILLLQLGAGQIAVMKDIDIWSNHRIGLFDHAYLLNHLVAGPVHIQRYSEWPPLRLLIWQNAPEALLISVCLLLAWLLYRGRRFGPVLLQDRQQRRTLREHVEAVARFHHQYGQLDFVLAPLRQQVIKRAVRLGGGVEQGSPEQQQQAIARQVDMPQELIAQALLPREHYTSAELVETVQLLIRIRNRL
ncbi:DUF4350 domain-containing protein [Marinobacterium marinum]|uniref:DUF4350 domain-containing protein n=1 Tax=Marinobacterium marinum TaxID=2756129 RepID=A0A7W1X013_9GAMM|nr:DUF4350 domain-containing protein [Marinobacterium marinum]MBA4503357.1 DUF4350 domain-containing protein [Marinobacterium marinum]